MIKVEMKPVSAMEKCFLDEALATKQEKNAFSMFQNERLAFQVAFRGQEDAPTPKRPTLCDLKLGGALAPYATVSLVENVPNRFPTFHISPGGAFLRTEPGLYPDLIRPLMYPNSVIVVHAQTNAMWVEVTLPEDFAAGVYDLSVALCLAGETLAETQVSVQVIDAKLPPQTLIHTEWFYADCIANYYNVKPFSGAHWRYMEKYIRTATRNGINMILVPVFTPELDTYVGGERLTTQLVEITLADGKYSFDFTKLHRFIKMCLAAGVQYFEIPHFFTQWGAKAAPKIEVKVNGRRRKYFGWHTDAMGEEYAEFLAQFIPALLGVLRENGVDKRCFFHVSDEPRPKQLAQYKRCKELIEPYLEGYPIIDALSDIDFYAEGVLAHPVPSTHTAMAFVEAGVPDLWVYYCGGGTGGASNRSISMPTWRTRMLGVQLYLYNIKGFLHWGYNFYNSWQSYQPLDPYGYPENGYFSPAGDSFLVYPGRDGEAWESLRLYAMRAAMDDVRALKLYESRFGREATEALICEGLAEKPTFVSYPADPMYLSNLRERITAAFAE